MIKIRFLVLFKNLNHSISSKNEAEGEGLCLNPPPSASFLGKREVPISCLKNEAGDGQEGINSETTLKTP